MRVVNRGHNFSLEIYHLCKLFLPSKTVSIDDSILPGEDYLLAGLKDGGADAVFAELGYGGAIRRAEAACEPEAGGGILPPEQVTLAGLVYELLAEATGKRPPWGILTGIRPVKLFTLVAAGKTKSLAETNKLFEHSFKVADEKITVSNLTVQNQIRAKGLNTKSSCSLYVSIPFCPSRCSYCSFVAQSIGKFKRLIPEYLRLLKIEIEKTGELLKELGLRLRTIYIGGGTPTVLSAAELDDLLGAIAEAFSFSDLLEYTVEAGRSETIDDEKLNLFAKYNVTRLSINPQTFNDDVLRAVGRRHSAADVLTAFEAARAAGHNNINMDIIAGLPGDSLESFCATVEKLIELSPENITVHSLSVKNAADFSKIKQDVLTPESPAGDMINYSSKALLKAGYKPYYLYRQKNTVSNLENTGYCKDGFEGLYNIFMMEELHSIFAVGAGGVTKIVNSPDDISRVYNFKYPGDYIARFDEIIKRKSEVKRCFEQI